MNLWKERAEKYRNMIGSGGNLANEVTTALSFILLKGTPVILIRSYKLFFYATLFVLFK